LVAWKVNPIDGPQSETAPGSSGVGQRVLIVDDNAEFRRLARSLLEHGGYAVVGEAGDGTSAVAACEALQPAIVLLDIQLPDMDGFQVADLLAAAPAAPAIVLISSRDSRSYRRQLAVTRARGFIAKAELSAVALAQALS
jgi:CheY-like chemotaxis protein